MQPSARCKPPQDPRESSICITAHVHGVTNPLPIMAPGHDGIHIGVATHYTTALPLVCVCGEFKVCGKGPRAPGFPSSTLEATVLSTAALPVDPAKPPCEFEIQRRDPDVSLLTWRHVVSRADFGHNISSHGSVFTRRFCSSLSRRYLEVHFAIDIVDFTFMTTLRFTCFLDIWSSTTSRCRSSLSLRCWNRFVLIAAVKKT